MDNTQWIDLFRRALRSMDDRLGQVVQLNDCREHWIQAEISLYAWYHERVEIWTGGRIGQGRKVDLYHANDDGSMSMIAEIKCLGDASQAKCLDGDWSVANDVERLRSVTDAPAKFFILVIPQPGDRRTAVGDELRTREWHSGGIDLELDSGMARIWEVH